VVSHNAVALPTFPTPPHIPIPQHQTEIKSVATALTASGLQKIGFSLLALDDCWQSTTRDPVTQRMQPDPERFPLGMLELVQWLHARGFTMGIYTSLGYETCSMAGHTSHLPGSFGYYQLDADTFASWEVDYVKVSNKRGGSC
jgi:alpha-galactosidase